MSSSYLKISIVAPSIFRLFVISWDYFLFLDRLSDTVILKMKACICMYITCPSQVSYVEIKHIYSSFSFYVFRNHPLGSKCEVLSGV